MNEEQREKFLDHLEAFLADIAPSYHSRLEALFEEAEVDLKRPELNRKQKLELCVGCRDDFYNGKNDLGIPECWCLKDAKLVWRKEVHIDQVPPWLQAPVHVLSCFRKPKHYYFEPTQER
jgi:hypothetical protein